jgi:hypothetical protein
MRCVIYKTELKLYFGFPYFLCHWFIFLFFSSVDQMCIIHIYLLRVYSWHCLKLRSYNSKWQNDKWLMDCKGCERKWLHQNLMHNPFKCLERMRKIMYTLSHDRQSLGQTLNPGLSQCKGGRSILILTSHLHLLLSSGLEAPNCRQRRTLRIRQIYSHILKK